MLPMLPRTLRTDVLALVEEERVDKPLALVVEVEHVEEVRLVARSWEATGH